jgi:hypothetical protein
MAILAQSRTVTTYGPGDSNTSLTLTANNTITLGNGDNSVVGTSNETITLGNGSNTVTVSPGAGNTIAVGNGPNTLTVGPDSLITVGNGFNTIYTAADSGVILGTGGNTVVIGLSLSRTTDIGNIEIRNFHANITNIIEFNRSLFANFAAVMKHATQIVGLDGSPAIVIAFNKTDTVTLDDMSLSELSAVNFQFK